MSRLDYFVVGRELAIESQPAFGPSAGPRLDFRILESPDREIGWIRTELRMEPHGRHVSVELRWPGGEPRPEREVEAIRLTARVLAKLVAAELRVAPVFTDESSASCLRDLRADGFRPSGPGAWILPAMGLAVPAERAGSLKTLYDDPLAVVWNFEPRPWDTLAPLLAQASSAGGLDVLDIGCGFGANARLLAGLGLRAWGVDVSPGAIAECRRWAHYPERFLPASVHTLPFGDRQFDAVLDVGCLHCMAEDERSAGVAELARVLRPGGWLFSRVLLPRGEEWLRQQRWSVTSLGLTPAGVHQLLESAFEVELTTDQQCMHIRARRR